MNLVQHEFHLKVAKTLAQSAQTMPNTTSHFLGYCVLSSTGLKSSLR
jgi:hypothetical protein